MVQWLARATCNPDWQAQLWVRITMHLSTLAVSFGVNSSSDPINPQWAGVTVIKPMWLSIREKVVSNLRLASGSLPGTPASSTT